MSWNPIEWLRGLRRRSQNEVSSNVVAASPCVEGGCSYCSRPHNAEMFHLMPAEQAEGIREIDQRSEAIYDQIDEHVEQLRQVRRQIAKKKDPRNLKRRAAISARTLRLYQPVH